MSLSHLRFARVLGDGGLIADISVVQLHEDSNLRPLASHLDALPHGYLQHIYGEL